MQVYDEVLVPRLFVPWARVLLDELDLQTGEAVLDVACGPGSATRLAAERVGPRGRVLGCDLSAAMLEVARTKPAPAAAAPIDYREATADALPVADESFDVAVCQQGLQFFPDREAALAELHRALRPGGRLGIAVWSQIGDSPIFAVLCEAIREVAGDELADRYRTGPWGFPSGERLLELVEAAGFLETRVEQRTIQVRFEGGAPQFASTLAAAAIAADIEALPPQQRKELLDTFASRAAPITADAGLDSPTVSNLAFAVR
jgi:ubiquinone/menaquinone biosynthesis C-methylase UbiE